MCYTLGKWHDVPRNQAETTLAGQQAGRRGQEETALLYPRVPARWFHWRQHNPVEAERKGPPKCAWQNQGRLYRSAFYLCKGISLSLWKILCSHLNPRSWWKERLGSSAIRQIELETQLSNFMTLWTWETNEKEELRTYLLDSHRAGTKPITSWRCWSQQSDLSKSQCCQK